MTLPTNITVGDPDHAGLHNAERAAINGKPDDFTDLGDTPTSLSGEAGKTLVVNTAGTALELADPSGGASELDDLLDVDTDGASDDDVLTYDDGSWVPKAAPGGGGGGDLSESDIDTLAKLNTVVTDATLDDASGERTPAEHGNEAHDVNYVDSADVGEPNGVASLDANGDVPADQLGNVSGGGVTAKNSVEVDDGDLQLVGDADAPGNDKVYGTDGSGVKGWKDNPAGGDGLVEANVQTGSYTLVLADAGKAVEMDVASANDLTVPPEASVDFPVGTVIEVAQVGAGQTTIVEGTGVDVRTPETLVLTGQWSTVSLRKRGSDEWLLAGDVEPS
jgi:hypothetical protein